MTRHDRYFTFIKWLSVVMCPVPPDITEFGLKTECQTYKTYIILLSDGVCMLSFSALNDLLFKIILIDK